MEYYSVIQKNEISSFGMTYMELKSNAKWNKGVRETQIPYDFIPKCNLRNKKRMCKGGHLGGSDGKSIWLCMLFIFFTSRDLILFHEKNSY